MTCRQRPATAGGTLFMTLEDETGIANLILRPAAYARLRAVARGSGAVLATGRVEHRSGVTHLLVTSMEDLGPWFAGAGAHPERPGDFR